MCRKSSERSSTPSRLAEPVPHPVATPRAVIHSLTRGPHARTRKSPGPPIDPLLRWRPTHLVPGARAGKTDPGPPGPGGARGGAAVWQGGPPLAPG